MGKFLCFIAGCLTGLFTKQILDDQTKRGPIADWPKGKKLPNDLTADSIIGPDNKGLE